MSLEKTFYTEKVDSLVAGKIKTYFNQTWCILCVWYKRAVVNVHRENGYYSSFLVDVKIDLIVDASFSGE